MTKIISTDQTNDVRRDATEKIMREPGIPAGNPKAACDPSDMVGEDRRVNPAARSDPATAPKLSRLGAWMLRQIGERLTCGSLTFVTPSGARIEYRTAAPGPDAVWVLHRWRAIRRLLTHGDIGFGEAYMDGDWSTPDLSALVELAARNDASLSEALDGKLPARMLHRLLHLVRANTRSGSRRNITQHYDLGNAFYASWLDPGMTYSSAMFCDAGMTLEAAQTAKQDRVLELLDVQQGQDVLEIGFGWGGMAERLAARGCRVVGLTLSSAQRDHATQRLAATGHADRVELRLQDYRDTSGVFDRIVSIEMLEAVGEAYWPVFFDALRSRLTQGGVAVLQAITIADERFASYRRVPDFIQRHIFPGGMLPSPSVMRAQIERAGLALHSVESFGASYARTLREWRERFHAAWPDIAAMGFPPRFRRMWDYYLCYCEGGFRAGAIDVGLWRLERTG